MGKILAEEKPSLDELTHVGVKGMKWGVRRAEKKQQKAERRVERGAELVSNAKARGVKNPARSTALRGAGEVAGILVGGSILARRIPGSQNVRNGGHIVKLAMAGKVGATRIGELRAINAYNQSKQPPS